MELNPDRNAVGVVVARFQVPDLHPGHLYTVGYALERHDDVLVILGTHHSSTDRNPLSFQMRRGMVESAFPGVRLAIRPSSAVAASYEERSRRVDALIREAFPGREATIYGSRDSFVHRYRGSFATAEVPVVYSGSATALREQVGVVNSPDFRRGVIYAANHRPLSQHPAVDVAVLDRPAGRVLLVEKFDEEGKLRFPGVFVRAGDASYEAAAIRCLAKELPGVAAGEPRLLRSARIDDWRFRRTQDGVITTLLVADYRGGDVSPGEGVDSTRWVGAHDLGGVVAACHEPLAEILRAHLAS